MKVCVYQQEFLTDKSQMDRVVADTLRALDAFDESMDLLVLPEGTDIPCMANSRQEYDAYAEKYTDLLLEKCAQTAKRCRSMVFVNASKKTEKGYRNTTFAFDREGRLAGTYDKQHLTPGEISNTELDGDYTFESSTPFILEMEGIRFAFLTCYDFYFYEAFSYIAQQKPDVIIGCARQRTDPHAVTEFSCQYLSYVTGAYVLRAGVSMGAVSEVGGTSLVCSPDGKLLLTFTNEIGPKDCEIEPGKKYLKPMGYGNPDGRHHDYTEKGRRPWKYRPAGPAMVRDNTSMPFPRICAHRGFSAVAPENSMPAFGAAVALGAQEMEFDLWYTADGEVVSLHDDTLERVSDGHGKIYEQTFAELQNVDFGSKFSDRFKGLHIVKFEDILKKFACQVIMNIHLKPDDGRGLPVDHLRRIIELIDKYDCRRHVYFMSVNPDVHATLKELAPDIERCMGENSEHFTIVDRAIAAGATRVQLFKPYFNDEMIKKAKEHGLRLNVFFADDPEEAQRYLDMGIDCVLSNNYLAVKNKLGV